MPKPQWTTSDQEAFLKARQKTYEELDNKKRKEFYDSTYVEWQVTWPDPEPTAEQLQKFGSRAENEIYKFVYERLSQWFRNHTRKTQAAVFGTNKVEAKGSKGSKGSKVSVLAKKRKWTVVQSYHNLTYEASWKDIIEIEYRYYRQQWTEKDSDDAVPMSRLSFMNSFMKARYEEEEDDVKQKVENHRQMTRDSPPVEDVNAAYQEAIEMLPRSIVHLGENISSRTGWHMTVLLGGPVPAKGGANSKIIYHFGKTPDGRNFGSFMGEGKFDKSVSDAFDTYLDEAFSSELRSERTLVKGEDEGDLQVADEKENGEVESHSEDNRVVGSGKKEDLNVTKPLISDYERTKQENIARNKKELERLGLTSVKDDMKKEAKMKRCRTNKVSEGERKDEAEQRRASARQAAMKSESTSAPASSILDLDRPKEKKAETPRPEQHAVNGSAHHGDGVEDAMACDASVSANGAENPSPNSPEIVPTAVPEIDRASSDVGPGEEKQPILNAESELVASKVGDGIPKDVSDNEPRSSKTPDESPMDVDHSDNQLPEGHIIDDKQPSSTTFDNEPIDKFENGSSRSPQPESRPIFKDSEYLTHKLSNGSSHILLADKHLSLKSSDEALMDVNKDPIEKMTDTGTSAQKLAAVEAESGMQITGVVVGLESKGTERAMDVDQDVNELDAPQPLKDQSSAIAGIDLDANVDKHPLASPISQLIPAAISSLSSPALAHSGCLAQSAMHLAVGDRASATEVTSSKTFPLDRPTNDHAPVLNQAAIGPSPVCATAAAMEANSAEPVFETLPCGDLQIDLPHVEEATLQSSLTTKATITTPQSGPLQVDIDAGPLSPAASNKEETIIDAKGTAEEKPSLAPIGVSSSPAQVPATLVRAPSDEPPFVPVLPASLTLDESSLASHLGATSVSTSPAISTMNCNNQSPTSQSLEPPMNNLAYSNISSGLNIANPPLENQGLPDCYPSSISEYLISVSKAPNWLKLVSEFIAFEKEGQPAGHFSPKQRPIEIKSWIKQNIKRKHEPVLVTPSSFGERFAVWWRAAQPMWRNLPDGKYSQEVPDSETWKTLRKGGTAGLFVVVMSLSWWVRLVDDILEGSDLQVIMDDLCWVLQQLRQTTVPGKRGNDDESDHQISKRLRKSAN